MLGNPPHAEVHDVALTHDLRFRAGDLAGLYPAGLDKVPSDLREVL
jgi:hypothetical protein